MASSTVFSTPLSLSNLLPSFRALSTQKPSQFPVTQKPQFPALSHSSSPLPFSLQTASTRLGLAPLSASFSYNVQVVVEEDEPEEKLLGRFRREVFRAGVIQECRRRRYFENKHDKKKRKNREAAKRNRKRRPQFRSAKPEPETVKKTKDDDLDSDNWDLPEDS